MAMPRKSAARVGRGRTTVREPQPTYRGLPALWRLANTPERETPLLLDTHVWLWLLDGTPGALDTRVQRALDHAVSQRRVYVSDFSFWEVAMLVSKGRLELAGGVESWLDRAATAPGITVAPVTRAILVRSTQLPGEPHGDPADRILLASAQALGAALLTCDRGIIDYAARVSGIAVCDAR
ncbi:type II toxin-antitoxin system VapC family toxin [Gemmatimonas sp.]|uniref:type II toxin-antitoxin system VapC family toxin n=1 Tax=Gemmatimonas sp. TaxID=1962908 RepID=UPI003340D5DB